MDEPLYLRLAAELRHRITSGEWPPGARIPSARDLQQQYAAGRGVVEQALAELRRDGTLAGRAGGRLTVAHPPAVRTLTDPDAPWPYGRGDTERASVRPSPEMRRRLGLPTAARICRERIELLDPGGRPAALLTTWQRRMRDEPYSAVRCEVRAHALAADEARLLGLLQGMQSLLIERTRLDTAGRPVQAADLVLPADRWRIGW